MTRRAEAIQGPPFSCASEGAENRRAPGERAGNGRTLYCARDGHRSSIPTTQCLTEAQRRLPVENMDELRDRVRTTNSCALRRTSGGGRDCGGG